MTELEIAGIGVWSAYFSNWEEFSEGINTSAWKSGSQLQPHLIPPRERRRAPQSVKLAVEVMSQACTMAQWDPANAAVVFSSAMGDMQITDYLCRTLAVPPRLVSPTRFHNSVHNATTGYWSIVSQTHAATSAVSALAFTAPMAFLEAAIQSAEEQFPVLLVIQEMAAPLALYDTSPSQQDFSAALLLTPPGFCSDPLVTIEFGVKPKSAAWPELPSGLEQFLGGNFGANLIPLLAAMAASRFNRQAGPARFEFPLSSESSIEIAVSKRKSTVNEGQKA
jgi:hypothetical protein